MTVRAALCASSLAAALATTTACSFLVNTAGLSGGSESDGGSPEQERAGPGAPSTGVVLGDASPVTVVDGSSAPPPRAVDASSGGAPIATSDAGAPVGAREAGSADAEADAARSACSLGEGRVFVTSALYGASFGGVAGADADCEARATAGGLGGVWRAWLSDSSTSASAHVQSLAGSYVLLDGTVVASTFNALLSGSLAHAIDTTELRATTTDGNTEVWTGLDVTGGMASAGYCADSSQNDWSSNDGSAATPLVGHLNAADATWTAAYLQACNRTNVRLYCFEMCL